MTGEQAIRPSEQQILKIAAINQQQQEKYVKENSQQPCAGAPLPGVTLEGMVGHVMGVSS
jgi:hypothetical protein